MKIFPKTASRKAENAVEGVWWPGFARTHWGSLSAPQTEGRGGEGKVKGRKRGKAFWVQQFSIYTRDRDPQAGKCGLCIPLGAKLQTPNCCPPLPSDPGDATAREPYTSFYRATPC